MAENNKYTILISGQLDINSIKNLQKSLDNVENLSAKITQFKVPESAITNLRKQIEAGLTNINVGLKGYSSSQRGTGASSAPMNSVEFDTGAGVPQQLAVNQNLIAQYEQIVQLVNRATQGAQAKVRVELDSANIAQRIVATYNDLDHSTKTITYNLEMMGEEGEEYYEWVYRGATVTKDAVKYQREQLTLLKKYRQEQDNLSRSLGGTTLNPQTELFQSAQSARDDLYWQIENAENIIKKKGFLPDGYSKDLETASRAVRLYDKELKTTNKTLKEQETLFNKTSRLTSTSLADIENRSMAIKQVKTAYDAMTELDTYMNSLSKSIPMTAEQATELQRLTKNAENAKAGMRGLGKDTLTFGQELGTALKRTVTWSIAMGVFYGSLREIKEGIEFVKDLDKSLTNIGVVTGQKVSELSDLARQYNSVAKELGSTTKEITEGALEFIRQGLSVADTNELIRVSTIQSKLANMSSAQSTEYLTSIMNGFRLEASDMMKVLDTLVNLDNNYATSVAEIAQAMQRSSVSAQIAGISLEELSSMITVVSSVTRQSAESIGESFKTIFARMQDVKMGKALDEEGEDISNVEAVLTKHGIALRDTNLEFRDLSDVLDDVATKWQSLGSVEQSELAKTIAGVRQRERFLVLMENWDKVKEAEIIALNSSGLAMDRYGIYLDSVEAKTNKLKATWESVWMKTINSGTIKLILDIANAISSLIDATGGLTTALTILSGVVLMLKADAIAGMIGKIITGFTTFSTVIKGLSATGGLASLFGAAGAGAAGAGAAGGIAGISALLPPLGVALAAIGVTVGIVNIALDQQRKALEEATTAVDEYVNRVESIPEKLSSAEETVIKLNELLVDFSAGELAKEQEQELYGYFNALHELIPEYEGWHYSKMGWYLEEQVELQKILDLIKAQGTMSPEERQAFKRVFKNESGEYKKLLNTVEDLQNQQKIGEYIKEYLENDTSGQSTKEGLIQLAQALMAKGKDVTTFEQDIIDTVSQILHDFNSYRISTPEIEAGYFNNLFGNLDNLEIEGVEKTKQLEGIANELVDEWSAIGEEFRSALREQYGDDNPLVAALDAIFSTAGLNPEDIVGEVTKEFKSFGEVLKGITETLSGDAQRKFGEFAGQILSLNSAFVDGKVGAKEYFDSILAIEESTDLKEMFEGNTDAARKFFATMVSNGAEAFNSLNSEFENGEITISSYMEGLVGANQMLVEQFDIMRENQEMFGITNEEMYEYDQQIKAITASTAASIEQMGYLQPTVDVMLAGFGDVMSGQIAQGSEMWFTYMNDVASSAWAMTQEVGASFTDLNGKMFSSAGELASFLAGGAGNFNHFANQLANQVSSFVNSAVQTTADGMRLLSEVTSSFELVVTPQVTPSAAAMPFTIPVFNGTDVQMVNFDVPIPGFILSGTATTKTSVPWTPVNFDSGIFLPPTGGGGYTPPAGGGGGGGGQDEVRNDAEKAYQDLLAMTIKMLKDRANQQKKALKEELDAYKKIIEAKKDDLDAQKERRAWENKEKEAVDNISNIEAELLQLQFDNSEEGIARRLELEQQLEEAKAALEEDRFNESIDNQKELLDASYAQFEDYIEARIKELDDYLEREGEIAQEAIELIEGRSEEFYNQLMEWNMTYGSGIASDVIDAWAGAITWIDTYAMGAVGALNATGTAAAGAGSSLASMGINAKTGLTNYAEGLDLLTEAIKRYRSVVTGTGAGTYHPNDPYEEEYHSGGIVGGTPRLPESEVFAKLLKGEHVSTEEEQAKFIRQTLPNLMSSSNNTGNYSITVPITVNGNLDKAVLPDIKESIADAFAYAMRNNGLAKQIA